MQGAITGWVCQSPMPMGRSALSTNAPAVSQMLQHSRKQRVPPDALGTHQERGIEPESDMAQKKEAQGSDRPIKAPLGLAVGHQPPPESAGALTCPTSLCHAGQPHAWSAKAAVRGMKERRWSQREEQAQTCRSFVWLWCTQATVNVAAAMICEYTPH